MKKIRLTKKREKWAENRGKIIFKGERLNYNVALEKKYSSQLVALVRVMVKTVNREVEKLFNTPMAKEFKDNFAQDANIASQARILTNALTDRFELLFRKKGKTFAESMILQNQKASKGALQNSLKKLSGGVTLKTDFFTGELNTILKAAVTENVALIKSISSDYLSKVQKMVMRAVTQGNGLQTVTKALGKYEGISERHAKNTALDQTRKVYSSVNAARMKKVGIKKFEWVHSGGGQRPRQDHIEMSGNIYSFDDLPVIDRKTGERGIPAQAINCKCIMVPVVEVDNENQEN